MGVQLAALVLVFSSPGAAITDPLGGVPGNATVQDPRLPDDTEGPLPVAKSITEYYNAFCIMQYHYSEWEKCWDKAEDGIEDGDVSATCGTQNCPACKPWWSSCDVPKPSQLHTCTCCLCSASTLAATPATSVLNQGNTPKPADLQGAWLRERNATVPRTATQTLNRQPA